MAVDASYSADNYQEQGGDVWVVDGELRIGPNGQITADGTQAAAIADLTDSTGGTADGELEAVGATNAGDVSGAINNNFAELNAKLDDVLAALRGAGIIAAS